MERRAIQPSGMQGLRSGRPLIALRAGCSARIGTGFSALKCKHPAGTWQETEALAILDSRHRWELIA